MARLRFILSSLIICVLLYTFTLSYRYDDIVSVSPTPRVILAMSVAISEMEYGITGYSGYAKVFKFFEPLWAQAFVNHISLANIQDEFNTAIEKSLNIEDPSSDGIHFMYGRNVALADYIKLAFTIFGYEVNSLFYLYFLLFTISVVVFLSAFYKRSDLLYILLLVVCSHFVILMAVPFVGGVDLCVASSRFYPVLTVVPTLHLAFLILRKHKKKAVWVLGASLQALILAFVIIIRTSAAYQLLFLITVTIIFNTLWYWKKKRLQIWPLAITFGAIFLLKVYISIGLHNSYTEVTSQHNFWHAAYLGIARHPEARNKHGIEGITDSHAYRFVLNQIPSDMGTLDYRFFGGGTVHSNANGLIQIGGEDYENIIEKEFIKVLKKDPIFVIESYLYKIPQFFTAYFSSGFYVVNNRPFIWPIFIVILGGDFLS